MKLPIAMSTVALVVAVFGSTPLGRAAYEAIIPANSVGTNQLKANAVTGAKIRNRSVQALDLGLRTIESGHVRDGSLLAADFGSGQIPAGPNGDRGEKGEKGDPGEPATRLWARVNANGSLAASSGVKSAGGGPPYDVSFDRADVRSCAYVVHTGRDVWAEPEPKAGANDTVRVYTGPNGATGARPFTLVVVC